MARACANSSSIHQEPKGSRKRMTLVWFSKSLRASPKCLVVAEVTRANWVQFKLQPLPQFQPMNLAAKVTDMATSTHATECKVPMPDKTKHSLTDFKKHEENRRDAWNAEEDIWAEMTYYAFLSPESTCSKLTQPQNRDKYSQSRMDD